MPYVHLKPSLSVYTFDGLPLGSYWEKYNVVKKTVINVLFRKEKCPSVTMDDIEDMHFVDIAQGKSDGKHFDGSVTIILKDIVYLNQKELQFEEYATVFDLTGTLKMNVLFPLSEKDYNTTSAYFCMYLLVRL
ncbi:hypothetical protein BJV82DRAFT_675257 [Fennellomyces sp. T-0311]|nr:hypothetical protein BJV82DRAFT_675257 [Fennellomyces sp. T-0311]